MSYFLQLVTIVAVLCLDFNFTSCQPIPTSNASETETQYEQRPILFVLSGGMSCLGLNGVYARDAKSTELYRQYEKIAFNLQKKFNVESAVMVSCFASRDEVIYYPFRNPSMRLSSSADDYAEIMADEIQRFKGKYVYLIGYSFGASSALNVYRYLTQQKKIQAFFSIDLIPRENCYFTDYVTDLLAYTYARGKFTASNVGSGCNGRAIIGSKVYARARAATLNWYNFYQQDFPVVYGSEIKFANVNQKISISNHWEDAHRRIDSMHVVWQAIEGSVQNLLNGYKAH